ncbi:MAG TPA: CapA family protein [Thermomicrobiaceae bacterium]|nr:CapA family protein [Thermomicrobiaceae bacterium]
MGRRFVVTATGDALITRRLIDYPDAEFQGMVELIKSADVAFTNMEMCLSNYRGTPVVESGGGNLSADPRVAKDLQRIGFNLTAFANNHTLNYGIEGCLTTIDTLDAYDFTCAGAGRNLAEARSPVYLDVPNGRVGLVACASTFANGQQAGVQRADAPGRPGLNPQRFDTYYVVDQEHLDAVKRIADRTGMEKKQQFSYTTGFRQRPEREDVFIFADRNFIVGDEFGVKTEAHQGDLAGNTHSVKDATELSDLTLVSLHAHEEGPERWEPADFIVELAHACVDAGADMVIGHGPHLLRGLEIYQGKPIFYSVGNFIFDVENLKYLPADDYESLGADPSLTAHEVFNFMFDHGKRGFPSERYYWETVLPIVTFEDRKLTGIDLHPVSLGFGLTGPERGLPRLAAPHVGQEILAWMAELSKPYGTKIQIVGGVGKVMV